MHRLIQPFIPCGVHEAIYNLGGLLTNNSDIQPKIVHSDTQAQGYPVFGSARTCLASSSCCESATSRTRRSSDPNLADLTRASRHCSARWALVRDMVDQGLSEQWTLTVARTSASTLRYVPLGRKWRIVQTNPSAGTAVQALRHRDNPRQVQASEAVCMNCKCVARLYQQARPQVRWRKRKKVLVGERQSLLRPMAANQVWSMDFAFDQTDEGRVHECRTIADDVTHEAVAIKVEQATSGQTPTSNRSTAGCMMKASTSTGSSACCRRGWASKPGVGNAPRKDPRRQLAK